jgi:hypothetical protein
MNALKGALDSPSAFCYIAITAGKPKSGFPAQSDYRRKPIYRKNFTQPPFSKGLKGFIIFICINKDYLLKDTLI